MADRFSIETKIENHSGGGLFMKTQVTFERTLSISNT